jgi:uncharacterized protein (AIM24 family)
MKSKITGTTMPVLEIGLEGSDRIIAEPGEFSWMTDGVQMRTTAFTAGAKGIWGALGRAFSGGGLFMTEYSSPAKAGVIAFAAKVPGSILQVDVGAGHSFLIHRHGFLCATEGVTLSTGVQRSLGAGIFGGNGFVMQKLSGPCTAWVELGGEAVIYDLAPSESLQVHPGHVGMITDTVKFDVTLMRGFSNAIFGGDGLFIAPDRSRKSLAANVDGAQSCARAIALPRRRRDRAKRRKRRGRRHCQRGTARHVQELARTKPARSMRWSRRRGFDANADSRALRITCIDRCCSTRCC